MFSAASADEPCSETEKTRFDSTVVKVRARSFRNSPGPNRVQQRTERAPDILIRERDGDRAIETVKGIIPDVGRPNDHDAVDLRPTESWIHFREAIERLACGQTSMLRAPSWTAAVRVLSRCSGRPRRNPRCSRSRYGMWRRISGLSRRGSIAGVDANSAATSTRGCDTCLGS